jgi:hypothetical protein
MRQLVRESGEFFRRRLARKQGYFTPPLLDLPRAGAIVSE